MAAGDWRKGIVMAKPNRPGERNSNAALSNADVDMMRDLYEEDKSYWTPKRLAEKFEISKRQVNNIVGYHQRVQREDEDD